MPTDKIKKRPGRRPLQLDEKVKVERTRQVARECRVRKRLRYQYLEDLVRCKEKAIFKLRKEIESFRKRCKDVDMDLIPDCVCTGLAKLCRGNHCTTSNYNDRGGANQSLDSNLLEMLQQNTSTGSYFTRNSVSVPETSNTSLVSTPTSSFSRLHSLLSNVPKMSEPLTGTWIKPGSHYNEYDRGTTECRLLEQASIDFHRRPIASMSTKSAVQRIYTISDFRFQENRNFLNNSNADLSECFKNTSKANECIYSHNGKNGSRYNLTRTASDLDKLQSMFDSNGINVSTSADEIDHGQPNTDNVNDKDVSSQFRNSSNDAMYTSNTSHSADIFSKGITQVYERSKTNSTVTSCNQLSDASQYQSANINYSNRKPDINFGIKDRDYALNSDRYIHDNLTQTFKRKLSTSVQDDTQERALNLKTPGYEQRCSQQIVAHTSIDHEGDSSNEEIDVDGYINYLMNKNSS